ncbi:type IV secretion system DNA-binding domain-containing protein [Bdellovibrionota bacterium FG-1]
MSNDFLNPAARKPDVPLSVALLAAAGFGLLFLWLKAPRETEALLLRLNRFGTLNLMPLSVAAASLAFNVLWVGTLAQRHFKKMALRSKTGRSVQEKTERPSWKTAVGFNIGAVVAAWILARQFVLVRIGLLPFALTTTAWIQGLAVCFFLTGIGLGLILRHASTWVTVGSLSFPWQNRLPRAPEIQDGIVLGAIHECGLTGDPAPPAGKPTEWRCQGLKGMTGNILITAAIGWGKSQVLLRLIKQCLLNFSESPTLLAIDPKRTFVRELRRIIESLGMKDRLLWVSLESGAATVRFNPIWREGMLVESNFTAVANSLRLASMNFIGSSSDSRFWEQSSFNLLKTALIYCAAKHDYFTFKELYRALVDARDGKIVEELVSYLATPESANKWNAEERGNLEMATNYFRSEFTQMDEKIRTSILATATSFLNEFLEYRVSRVLSPERSEINLPSMTWAVREGKMICIHIENDALARSIGTLLKLLYQEAILARVRGPEAQTFTRHALLIMDEYQDVATSGGGAGLGDDRFLAMARESKSITIAATQSVSSLENAIRSPSATAEILQNFRTRVFGNTTDPKTVRLFQEPHGQVERERSSHNFSESAQNAKTDVLFGGFDGGRSSISEGVSTHTIQEFPITAREFARLRAFEAFAQIFDGLETQFEKLFLKPHYLTDIRTPHRKVLEDLRKAAEVGRAPHKPKTRRRFRFGVAMMLVSFLAGATEGRAGLLFPNVCSVVKAGEFSSCLDFQVGACMCGWPIPRPCAQISYYVPQTFLEVWPNPSESFFKQHPAAFQLGLHAGGLPFGAEDDNATFSFHAHSIAVPLTGETFSELPCGGARMDKPCFDMMSEDVSDWKTGKADLLQPSFLAWQLSPKACILKGAAEGVLGGGSTPSIGMDSGGCSFPLPLPKYPPSPREACNGWGVFYPRYGVYHGASQAGAALMIAARLKSLGAEITHTIPGDLSESWQMLYPQSSSCFKEGQSLGLLEPLKGVREEQRMLGKLTGYLFVVWKKVSCCRDIAEAPAAFIAIQALRLACVAVPSGGI